MARAHLTVVTPDTVHQLDAARAGDMPAVQIGRFTVTPIERGLVHIATSTGEGGLFNEARLANAIGEFYDREF